MGLAIELPASNPFKLQVPHLWKEVNETTDFTGFSERFK